MTILLVCGNKYTGRTRISYSLSNILNIPILDIEDILSKGTSREYLNKIESYILENRKKDFVINCSGLEEFLDDYLTDINTLHILLSLDKKTLSDLHVDKNITTTNLLNSIEKYKDMNIDLNGYEIDAIKYSELDIVFTIIDLFDYHKDK